VNDRLWVTGLGLVTPLGGCVEATWSRLVRGDRAIAPARLFDASGQRSGLVAEVDGVIVPTDPPGGWSRTSAMALTAAAEAMAMARLEATGMRVGLVVGGTTGGMFETERSLARLHAEPGGRDVPGSMLSHPLSATGDRLDERLGPFARVRTLSSACSSSANALVVAATWLRSGAVDAVVAGGSDGLCRLTVTGFNSLGAIDSDPCRPFDRRRRGTTLGEGAGFVVLERAESALSRGALPVAELAGWATGSEAHHITSPAPDGIVVAELIERALARAGMGPADVDYVNAHGTGTPANDSMEAAALARAFGDELARIPVSSSKGQIGHTLGAAGGIEAVITALVLARTTLVPTAGLDTPDPAFDLVHVPHVGRRVQRVRAAVSNAFGFGGLGTVLVFAEPHRPAPEDRPTHAPPRGERRASSRGLHPSGAGAAAIRPVITGVSVLGPAGLMGAAGCADLLSQRILSETPVDPDAHLDAARARRLDRTARLATVVVLQAIRNATASPVDSGVVLGSAFGSVDATAAFLHRVFQKGPRAASPAEFPNLVPSSPVGHVSIYAGMQGPAFATADLATSGDSAFAAALELVEAGESKRIVAAAAEPTGEIAQRVFSRLFAYVPSQAVEPRSDLAAAIAVESDGAARDRGAERLARVAQHLQWRGDGEEMADAIRAPRTDGAEVVVARPSAAVERWLERSAWRLLPCWTCSTSLGESDALGAVAIAVAAARVGTGCVAEALVVGIERGRGYALVLAAP
jgi:3-oxoacyl-[acyl-carrier-protein] synthase II